MSYSRKNRRGIRRWIPSIKQIFFLGLFGAVAIVGLLSYEVKVTHIPAPNEVSQAQASIFYYDDGTTELGRLGEANRVSITIDQVPLDTQHAVLAAEDRQFYQHGGFSIKGISRAVWNNVRRSSTQGGSTITQQYAKNAYLTDERRIQRKLKELVLSIKLETITSKDKILENYLNTIYFGRGAYGIETASNQYFGKSVKDLTIEESAVLAAIIQAPNGLAPETNLASLESRWKYVLDGMVSQGWLDQTQRDAMVFPTIRPRQQNEVFGGPQGHLLETARQALYAQGFTEDQVNRAGLRVITTFNKQAEDSAIAAVEAQAPTTKTEGLRIGLASVRPGTGEVVAIYGGADYLKDQLNNATQAIGQAGSNFKPFTLAAALENNISLSSTFSGMSGTKVKGYVVVNYSGHSYGPQITLLKATENSVNSAYVQCEDAAGLTNVMNSALRAGIPENTVGMDANLTFTLGTASPHPIDVASAYSTFAARGLQVKPAFIKKVFTDAGDVLFEYSPRPVQSFSTDITDTVNYALQKVVSEGTGFAARALGRPAAGKTGTTNDNMSAWFSGYTPDLATSVMLVKDGPGGQPISLSGTGGLSTVTGGSFPARIWTAYMKGALQGLPITNFAPLPTGVPNGAKPTATPSESALPLPTDVPSASPSETPSVTPTDPVPSDVPVAQVTVPNFTGPLATAQATAVSLGINLIVVDKDATVKRSKPLFIGKKAQNPVAGTKIDEGSSVTVTVSNTAP